MHRAGPRSCTHFGNARCMRLESFYAGGPPLGLKLEPYSCYKLVMEFQLAYPSDLPIVDSGCQHKMRKSDLQSRFAKNPPEFLQNS